MLGGAGDKDGNVPNEKKGGSTNNEQGEQPTENEAVQGSKGQAAASEGEAGANGNAYAEGGDAAIKPNKPELKAGTPEHKADRWSAYQERGGEWSYDRWSKQYDTNMQNASYGLYREQAYRDQLGGKSETVKTPHTNRQIDISKPDEMYAGQVKTGKMSLTKQAKIDITKDAAMVKDGYKVEYILEKGASKSFLNALKTGGIDYKIGPQIP